MESSRPDASLCYLVRTHLRNRTGKAHIHASPFLPGYRLIQADVGWVWGLLDQRFLHYFSYYKQQMIKLTYW